MIEDNRVDNLILPNLHNSYKYYNLQIQNSILILIIKNKQFLYEYFIRKSR